MEFDITELDKKLLLQALFAHSAPQGLGKAEYLVRTLNGENVDVLSDNDCAYLLGEFNHSSETSRTFGIADYHDGKPMKLNFYRNKHGRVLAESDRYDSRNGKYRFLEAMLNTFTLDEIKITKKGYRQYVMSELREHLVRSAEQEKMFKTLLKNTIAAGDTFGKYYAFDEAKANYTPPYMDV